MKKLLLLLTVFTLTFTSCSNDDDGGCSPTGPDPIIGVWNVKAIFVDNVEQPQFPCLTESTVNFQADGNLTTTVYESNPISGDCEIEEIVNFTWVNAGNGDYTVTDEFGEADTQQVVFEDDTFYTEEVDDNGTPGDTSDDTIDRIVYQKQ